MDSVKKYGLPKEVEYCTRCTMSNQRPSSTVEFQNNSTKKKQSINFDSEGVCSACRYAEKKVTIDWAERERMLSDLCDQYRRGDGRFDVVVPGSGGKDSVVAAHMLKYKYNMNPILVTWPPAIYTKIGRANFDAWLSSGFTNYTYNQNKKLHRFLTQQSFLNLCHPFQPFILGQKNLAPRISTILDVPLVIFGENEAEYGNPIGDNTSPTRDSKFYSARLELEDLFLGGVSVKEIIDKHGYKRSDLDAYLPTDPDKIQDVGTVVHYLGYYIKWHPQEVYYYSVENTDFEPNYHRTEGSYTKYSSLDDKIDWLHYYTTYIKFGIGRATYDTAQEIRNGNITREEGVSLIKRFDGEFPEQYLNDCLKYMEISKDKFLSTIEEFRSDHLWTKDREEFKLVKPIWGVQQ